MKHFCSLSPSKKKKIIQKKKEKKMDSGGEV